MDIKRIPHSPNKTFTKKIPMPLPDYILICIALLSALMYMVLFLFGSIPIYAIALLISVWLFYWLKSCHLSFVTPLNYPIICLLIVASLGLFISTDLALFLPKMAGLIIGVSTFFVIVNFFRFRQRLTPVIFLLLFLALAISFLAFLGTEWTEDGIGFINQFYSKLPNFPFFNEREGINKNTMGGALTFFPPLLLSLLWDGGAFSRFKSRYPRFTNIPDLVYKFLVLLILVLVLLALLLTQSRGAWLGCVAGAILFLVLKNKHFLWTIPLLIVTFLFFLFTFADGNLVELLSILDTSQEATLPDRLEIWQKAFYIFRDF
ncbi:MAG: hypothetical protein GX878_11015, partial [Firmicutes bacterium]|nr:hypothetical protein [Bacillota bacterium]